MALDIAFALEGIARDEQRRQLEEALRSERNSLARRVDERTAELSRTNAELAHALRAKDEFLAMMSHELRSPLNAILGFSESLQAATYDPLSAPQQTAVQHIETSGRHLLALINDILDLSKVEAGRLDLQSEVVSIADVCQASLLFVREMALKQRLHLEFQINDQASQMIADPRRLKQILVNLLSNAVKFTEAGGRVCLEVVIDTAASVVTFAVQDSGIGIAPEDMAKLFQPFTQLDSRLSRQHAGTGLGLALVRRLAELHGGSIAVESTPDVGSRFTVALPYTPTADSKLAPTPAESTPDSRSALAIDNIDSVSILLAEDNEANIITIGDYLQAQGYRLIIARNGREALAMAAEMPPNLILMDIQMPEMDGLEAIRQLRAIPAFATTPIIALTALAMPGDRERCLEAGADEYLTKPVRLKSLIETIRRLLTSDK